ncbi:MAG: hypothetical protein H6565_01605 [Lewinellaceae bacterium]|nr:hypothetical protein [Lewinellaceae bacterium]MCB9356086.1 hypothetical protein [Lewinellaceae bacterium]
MERALGFSKDCFVVPGSLQSAIYDTRRQDYALVSNRYAADLHTFIGKSESYVRAHMDPALLQFLIEREYVYFWPAGLLDRFADISMSYEAPFFLENAIIEGNDLSALEPLNLLLEAGCRYFLIILHDPVSPDELDRYLSTAEFRTIPTLELHLNKVPQARTGQLKSLVHKFPFISSLCVYNGRREQFFIRNQIPVAVTKKAFPGLASFKSPDTFFVNLQLFVESRNHNPYFHKKIYIGPDGGIRSSPEDPETHGNIHHLNDAGDIVRIVEGEHFQKYWNVSKDKIDVCRSCEFRYMCVDARLPLPRSDGSWYFADECAYNPFLCKWQWESGYQALVDCGVRSDPDGFQVDEEALEAVRQETWADIS